MTAQTEMFDTPSPRLSIETAALRRSDGMERARKHACQCKKDWSKKALDALQIYTLLHGRPFLAETFLEWTRSTDVPQPPDGRAWGSVFAAARKQGIIERVGTGNAKTSNLSPKPMWQRRP